MKTEVIIPFRCSEEEKAALTQKAVKENGLTVSEYIKQRVFYDNDEANEGDLSIIEESALREEIEEHRQISDRLRKQVQDMTKTVEAIKAKRNTILLNDKDLAFIEDYINPGTLSKIGHANSLESGLVKKLNKENFISICIEYFKQNTSGNIPQSINNIAQSIVMRG